MHFLTFGGEKNLIDIRLNHMSSILRRAFKHAQGPWVRSGKCCFISIIISATPASIKPPGSATGTVNQHQYHNHHKKYHCQNHHQHHYQHQHQHQQQNQNINCSISCNISCNINIRISINISTSIIIRTFIAASAKASA